MKKVDLGTLIIDFSQIISVMDLYRKRRSHPLDNYVGLVPIWPEKGSRYFI